MGKRSLPYLVNSTNYGTLDTAWTAFLQKLEELLPLYADDSSQTRPGNFEAQHEEVHS